MQQTVKSFRCTIVGDACIGKTVMLSRFCGEQFNDDYVPTLIEEKHVNVNCRGQIVRLTVIDTAGQEDFDRLRLLAYQNTDVILLGFSLVSRDSFDNICSIWMPEIRQKRANVPVVLVGMKVDLCPRERAVTHDEATKLCRSIGAAAYLECSGKMNKGVHEVFNKATSVLLGYESPPAKSKGGSRGRGKRCDIL